MKGIIGALILGNVVLAFWWTGQLSPLWEPAGHAEREPLRSARQLRPDSVAVMPPRPRNSDSSKAGAWAGPADRNASGAAPARIAPTPEKPR